MATVTGIFERLEGSRTRLRAASLVLTVLCGATWIFDAGFGDLPTLLMRGVVLAWLVALAGWGLAAALRVARRRDGDEGRVTTGGALLLLLGLSFVLRLVGIDFELIDHFHNDEGIFRRIGEEINGGQLLPDEFHYPHLLYYFSAFGMWLKALFTPWWDAVARVVFGVGPGLASTKLALRAIGATMGALTTLPVFWVAYRIAGKFAAVAAGALIAFSPVYNDVAHLFISDVPSGFFAALTLLFVARLLDGENLRDYLLAGVCSGLAAASKYPAGVVAVAIVGMWLYWRWRERNLRWGLLWSGLASIGAFLAAMPALVVRYQIAFAGSGQDVTFGFRQYARSGWIGVRPQSNALYYLERGLENFGWPALLFGLAGLVLLDRRVRRRLLAMLPYPLVFLWLMVSMSMVVKRNLQPVLPMLAVVLGVGISAWLAFALRRAPGRRSLIAAVLLLGCLAVPAARIVAWDFSRTRPGTRQLAVAWIAENLPRGASMVKESYTPSLNPRHYGLRQTRYAGKFSVEELRAGGWDYLFLARNAHRRFLDPANWSKDHHGLYAGRYEEMFELELVEEFVPGATRAGPALLLYKVDPEEITYAKERRFERSEIAFYSDPALQPRRKRPAVRFNRRGQYVVFKEFMAPGEYEITVNPDGTPFEGAINVATRENRQLGDQPAAPSARYHLEARAKYLFYVFATEGELTGLSVMPVDPVDEPGF